MVTTDPARWQAVGHAVDALTRKVGQWRRWRDERAEGFAPLRWDGAGVVAAQGRRLRRRIGVGIILGILAAGVYAGLTALAVLS